MHITDCTFKRSHGALTLGTEATQIRDIEMDHCNVMGNMPMLRIKMRPDTPGQDYQNVRVHDIKLDGRGRILSFELLHGTKVPPKPPRAMIRNISISDITGTFDSFGTIASNPNTDISDISLTNIKVNVTEESAVEFQWRNRTDARQRCRQRHTHVRRCPGRETVKKPFFSQLKP